MKLQDSNETTRVSNETTKVLKENDVTHKKSATPNKKIFFKCSLEDWLIRLSPWTAL